jgi:hypothetical protein
MWEATEMLRRVDRFFRTCNKFKSIYMTENVDLSKAALPLFELETMIQTDDLTGIDLVDAEMPFIKRSGSELRQQSQQMLITALQDRNQSHIGTCLQTFFHLEALPQIITQLTEHVLTRSHQIIQSTFDLRHTQQQQKKGTSQPGNITRRGDSGFQKSQFLLSIKNMLQELVGQYMQIYHLDSVLAKKRDPLTLVKFESVIRKEGELSVLAGFWKSFTSLINKEFNTAIQTNGQVKNVFVEEYPQLLKMLNEFALQFKGYTPFLSNNVQDEDDNITDANFNFLQVKEWAISTVKSIEMVFLADSHKRLFDRIDQIFNKIQPPTEQGSTLRRSNSGNDLHNQASFTGIAMQDIRTLSSTITQELASIQHIDMRLFGQIVKNVTKSLDYFATNFESKIARVPTSSTKPIDSNNPALRFNATLYSAITRLQSSIAESITHVITTFQGEQIQDSIHSIDRSIKKLEQLGKLILEPLFDSMVSGGKLIIAKMHMVQADYISELENWLKMWKSTLSSLFDAKTAVTFVRSSQACAEELISTFVKHIAIRQFDDLQSLNQVTRFELVINSMLWNVDDLNAYKSLKGIKKLLYVTQVDDITQQQQLVDEVLRGHLLDKITVINFLVYHSRLIDPLPNTLMGVSILEYYKFLIDNRENTKPIVKQLERSINNIDDEKMTPLLKLIRDMIVNVI